MRGVGLLLLMLATAVCSAPPDKERHQADGAISAARAAGAARYAPELLAAAEQALVRYDELVAARDFRQALSVAIDAREQAFAATAQSSDRKAAARAEAERLLLDLERATESADRRLSGQALPRATGATQTRLKAARARAPRLMQEASTLIDRGEYREAISRLRPFLESLQRDLAVPARRGGK
jgi:hypothetical protein